MTATDRGERVTRREEIVRAATEVFAERGYRGTSLAAVAERAGGITAQGVLHHFGTKEALLLEVLRARQAEFARSREGVGDDGIGFVERMRRVVAIMQRQPGIPQSMMVLSADSVTAGHPAHSFFVERYAGLRAHFAADLGSELGDPLPSGLSADAAATLVVAMLDGLRLQWLLDPGRVDIAQRMEDFLMVLCGSASPAHQPPG
ncbi:TetR/AcrR family transcriptional regulator [Motilibacter aurantiacus]|uniref:TetR/AcrR family transcriptional regulator n=1 Tax=Motilibacter aurantiacus TaxID=2714955 RepID=UPI00140BA61A|nr:TetR/AcrR family transcriptional regulator [Motilibacter aurantiacus]NHC46447.1 TetR/AcrR family transcriptional regulator [Motilibacter aurantiacus]